MASLHISELFTFVAFSTLSLLSIALVLLFLYVSKTFLSFLLFYLQESIQSSHCPRPPVAGTIFNQLINFGNLFDYFTKLSLKHKTFRLVKPTHSDIYTTDPANIEYFLKTNFSNYNKGRINHEIMKDLFGDGIFAVDGDKWRHQRKLASYEFSTKVLRDFSTDVFRTKAAKLAKKVAKVAGSAAAIDMQDLLMKSTMDSIFKVGFGVELETLSGTDEAGVAFSKAFDESNHMVFRRFVDIFWKAKRRFNIGLEAQLKRNLKVIDEFVFQLIQRKREQMESRANDKMKEDILSRFVLASQKDAAINDRYLRDIILNFLIAGKDTSGNTLSWFLYLLCKNPLVQEKIVAEIKAVTEFERGGSIDGFVYGLTEVVLDKLQYLHAALAETLRLFPAVPLDGKFAEEDDELPDGFKVKKGDGVTYISYAMGRMTYLWGEDAEDFRPERWLKIGTFQPESSFKFVSFHSTARIKKRSRSNETEATMAEETVSQTGIREETDYQISQEIPIPSFLKFLMNSIKTVSQTPLTAENYHIWSNQLLKLFRANGFESFLDHTRSSPPKFITSTEGNLIPNPNYQKWALVDQNLSAALYATISASIVPYVLNLDTTAEIWVTLAKRLQASNRSRIIQLKNELHHVSMKDSSMSKYLSEIKTIVDQLAAAGTTIDNEDIVLYTLNGLPPSYQAFKMAIRTKLDPIALDDFYALLASEEINITNENNQAIQQQKLAMNVTRTRDSKPQYRGRGRQGRGGRSNNNNRNQRQNIECQICSKMGHSAKSCWYRMTPDTSPNQPTVLISDNKSTPIPQNLSAVDDWYLDTGASAHLTHNYNNLQQPQQYTGYDQVTVGNGDHLPITHVGKGSISTANKSSDQTGALSRQST